MRLLSPDDTDHNFLASAAGQLAAAYRWRGTTTTSISEETVRFAESQPGLPIACSLATVGLALAGDLPAAHSTLTPVVSRAEPFLDDTTLAGQLATLIEACVLTGHRIPRQAEELLRGFSGQLLVLAWGVDVHGAADRFLGVLAALAGDIALATDSFTRAEELERRVSTALPLRTQVWRHAFLGDVSPPKVPANLSGLNVEAAALKLVAAGRM